MCFAHSGVWAETGLTATGHAWEMRGKCACFVICLCLLSVLFGFSVFVHFVKWATCTNMCYKCMGNEILAGLSHRSSDTHISFSTEKQRISRALPAYFPRIKNAFYTVFCSFRRLGRERPEGHRTCVGNAFILSFACACCLFCLVLVCFPFCQIGDLHKTVLQMHGK